MKSSILPKSSKFTENWLGTSVTFFGTHFVVAIDAESLIVLNSEFLTSKFDAAFNANKAIEMKRFVLVG